MSKKQDGSFQVFNAGSRRVEVVTPADMAARLQDGEALTRAMPARLNDAGHAVYHPTLHSVVAAGLRVLSQEDGHGQLPHALYHDPQAEQTVLDMLITAAAEAERAGSKKQHQLWGLATALEDGIASTEHWEVEAEDETAWEASRDDMERVLQSIENRQLSNGSDLGASLVQTSHEQATRMITRAMKLVERPFTAVINELQRSMQSALEEKIGLRAIVGNTEDQRALDVEIIALRANLSCCATFLIEGADYDTYQALATHLTSEIQDRTTDRDTGEVEINTGETELQAITSLKDQIREACRLRSNAVEYLYGNPAKPGSGGLVQEAVAARRRELSHTLIDDVPAIDVYAAQRFGIGLANKLRAHPGRITIESEADLLQLYRRYLSREIVLADNEPDDDVLRQRLYRERLLDDELRGKIEDEVSRLADVLHRIVELGGANLATSSFESFVARTYLASVRDDQLDQLQAWLWTELSPALDYTLAMGKLPGNGYRPGDIVRHMFDQHLADVARDISAEDFIAIAEMGELNQLRRSFSHNLVLMLDGLEVLNESRSQFVAEHIAEIGDVLVAAYELQLYANDTHLNMAAVIRSLAEARLTGRGMSLQVIRCLRWCYPNREVAIVPHAGDYETASPNGSPLTRHEWVEREKLAIYNRCVVQPLLRNNIPVADITLLATGDYELDGPGYNFPPDHPQRQNALSYVASLSAYVRRWSVFPDGLPVRVVTLKEMAATVGQNRFEQVLAYAQSKYDGLKESNDRHFMGWSAKIIERVLDREHGSRMPFITWWDRDRSRSFTRHKTTWEWAMGAMAALLGGPRLLTISGNEYSGRTFAVGGKILRQMQSEGLLPAELGIRDIGTTFMLSVNDGTQSRYFARETQVVA